MSAARVGYDKDGNFNYEIGAEWLGIKYYKSIGKKPFPISEVINGILSEQKIWNQNFKGEDVHRDEF